MFHQHIFLPSHMFRARAQTMAAGTWALRLTGWRPHAMCDQTPGHCLSCTRIAHTTVTNPGHPPTDRLRTRRAHTTSVVVILW
jgi:hypothetical protein